MLWRWVRFKDVISLAPNYLCVDKNGGCCDILLSWEWLTMQVHGNCSSNSGWAGFSRGRFGEKSISHSEHQCGNIKLNLFSVWSVIPHTEMGEINLSCQSSRKQTKTFYIKNNQNNSEQQKKTWNLFHIKIRMGFQMLFLWEKDKFLIHHCFSRLPSFVHHVFWKWGSGWRTDKIKQTLYSLDLTFHFCFLWHHLVWWEVAIWWGQALYLRTTLILSNIMFKGLRYEILLFHSHFGIHSLRGHFQTAQVCCVRFCALAGAILTWWYLRFLSASF